LRAAGHDVVLAGGGREALARYYSGPRPDVVILDLDMPDMCGDECWRRLRELDPAVRAFFLSGSCDEKKRQALLRDGALGFLEKPVDASVLRDAVTRALAR
jgi:CheY-like chemotaxis protein